MDRRSPFALVLAVCAAVLVACGGGGGGGAGGGGAAPDAKAVQPSAADNASGNVNLCIGKDTTGIYRDSIERFNKQGNVTAKLTELPESADEQRTQLVQRSRAKSPECDVMGLDVIWTAEFAAQGWLMDVSPAIEQRRGEFIPATLDTAKFDEKYWGVPFKSNAGFLYYRKDQTKEAPKSWEQVYELAAKSDGIVYQGARYEGLTVNFLELLYSAGGTVLSEDGSEVTVNSQEAKDVLKFMADGVRSGAASKAVTTYKEEEARRAFENGKASFMRNWPYAYKLGDESKIKGDFDITTFPSYGGAEGAGVLGGYNFAISAYSKNPGGALAFINYMTGQERQEALAETAEPPVIASAYTSRDVDKAFPFGADLMRAAIEQAKPRPVSPVYPQISQAIYDNVHSALTGKAEPNAAIEKMSSDIEKALETF